MIAKELVAKARKANLVEFFRCQGYHLEPVKSKRGLQYKIDNFGGLYVRDHMFYQFSTEKKGNAIECLTTILGYSFKDAVTELTKPEYETVHTPYVAPQNQQVVMPERAKNVKRIYSYLINSRGLDPSIISLMVQHKLLYQDVKGNAVFVHKDENGVAIGGEIHGSNTSVRFKGIVDGTVISAFEIEKGKPEKVFLFESAIDLLSYIQMNRQNKEENNVLYKSMGGLKKELVHQSIGQGLKIVSKVDHDMAGDRFNKAILLEVEIPGIQLFQNPLHSHVYGINATGQYVFTSNEDYHFYKDLLPVNIDYSILTNLSDTFVVDNYLAEAGVKDWNELLLNRKGNSTSNVHF